LSFAMPTTQAVILVGGLGSRLGDLTATTPKPLLPVAGVPFLDYLLFELGRYGIRSIILAAQFESEKIREFARQSAAAKQFNMNIAVAVEPMRADTGGAIFHAQNSLEDQFFLMNGDSWLDFNLLNLAAVTQYTKSLASVAVRPVDDTSRYGVVELDGQKIISFSSRSTSRGSGMINGGIYHCRKELLKYASEICSFERDVLPKAAIKGELSGLVANGYFIDIGIPADYQKSQDEIPAQVRRPAVFFDRDGVLNEDLGHVGSIERFVWTDGAVEAIKYMNDRGYFVFVVTNQAGVAKGLYTETDVRILHDYMQTELGKSAAHIDAFEYCPYHPEGIEPRYRKTSEFRKPQPGMILDLFEKWPLECTKSLLIGDKSSDIEAAKNAKIAGHLFEGGSLFDFVRRLI
jgi:D,D-heptose 1,7-bisphosphate phosphatase